MTIRRFIANAVDGNLSAGMITKCYESSPASDGSGGSYTLDGVQDTVAGKFTRVDPTHYRLDGSPQYDTLVVSPGIYLDPNLWVVCAKRFTFDGIIDLKGADGADAAGVVKGSGNGNGTDGGNGANTVDINGRGFPGSNAEAGGVGGGNAGKGGQRDVTGNPADNGGAGGLGSNEAAGDFVADPQFRQRTFWRNPQDEDPGWLYNLIFNLAELFVGVFQFGGGGGGGGAGTIGGGGLGVKGDGGGGGEGGSVKISAQWGRIDAIFIVIAGIFEGVGTIDLRGGKGGKGANGTNGTNNNGGGGGGGGGGGATGGLMVALCCSNLFAGSILLTGGLGGDAGVAGAQGPGAGVDSPALPGVAGLTATDGQYLRYSLS